MRVADHTPKERGVPSRREKEKREKREGGAETPVAGPLAFVDVRQELTRTPEHLTITNDN